MSGCRICRSAIEPFIDFGRMPLANGFLLPDQFADEYFFNLSAAYCRHCTLVQLVEQPERERMFNERYPFFSASSTRMASHFGRLAAEVIAALPNDDPFMVEIGSNDGTLLCHAVKAGVRHLASSRRRASPRQQPRGASIPPARSSMNRWPAQSSHSTVMRMP